MANSDLTSVKQALYRTISQKVSNTGSEFKLLTMQSTSSFLVGCHIEMTASTGSCKLYVELSEDKTKCVLKSVSNDKATSGITGASFYVVNDSSSYSCYMTVTPAAAVTISNIRKEIFYGVASDMTTDVSSVSLSNPCIVKDSLISASLDSQNAPIAVNSIVGSSTSDPTFAGTASYAVNLKNARDISVSIAGLGSSSVSFNGGSSVPLVIDKVMDVSHGGTGVSSVSNGYVLVGSGTSPEVAVSTTSANIANAIVRRDAGGNIVVGSVTGNLIGNASTATLAVSSSNVNVSPMNSASKYYVIGIGNIVATSYNSQAVFNTSAIYADSLGLHYDPLSSGSSDQTLYITRSVLDSTLNTYGLASSSNRAVIYDTSTNLINSDMKFNPTNGLGAVAITGNTGLSAASVSLAGTGKLANLALGGTLSVANGGTGSTSFSSGYLLVGNGSSAVGVIEDTSSNKANTIVKRDSSGSIAVSAVTGALIGNAATASKLNSPVSIGVSVAGLSASTVQFDGSSSIGLNLNGVLSVANGGTGLQTLSAGQLLTGNTAGAVAFTPKSSAADANAVVIRDGYGGFAANNIVASSISSTNVSAATIYANNIIVSGNTTTISKSAIAVEDYVITLGSANTTSLTSMVGLRTPKYDGTNDGFLGWDASGTAYIGDISTGLNDGSITSAINTLQPLATREPSASLANYGGNFMAWDVSGNRIVHTSYNQNSFVAAAGGNASTATSFKSAFSFAISGAGLSGSGSYGTGDTSITLSGTIPVSNGGTGNTSLTADKVLVGNGTSAIVSGPAYTNSNTGLALVQRDANGNFSAGTITATIDGTATNSSKLGGTEASKYLQKAAISFSGGVLTITI